MDIINKGWGSTTDDSNYSPSDDAKEADDQLLSPNQVDDAALVASTDDDNGEEEEEEEEVLQILPFTGDNVMVHHAKAKNTECVQALFNRFEHAASSDQHTNSIYYNAYKESQLVCACITSYSFIYLYSTSHHLFTLLSFLQLATYTCTQYQFESVSVM